LLNKGKIKTRSGTAVLLALILLFFVSTLFAQSTNLEFPTPVTSSQITGRIKARDIGDSRLTTHYYLFETGTGDVLLNIESSNLNGDFDVYTAGSLKPLLKASVYATGYATAMQREIYLRLPSRLILRVEGRTPNDDPADYRISFSGVFKPLAASSVPKNPGDPKVTGTDAAEGAVARVSSVGTIIEEIKPPPPKEEPPKATVAKNTPKEKPRNSPTANTRPKPASGNTGEIRAKTVEKPKTAPPAANTASPGGKKPTTTAAAKPKPKPKPPAAAASTKPAPDPLASVFLVIRLKDDTVLRYAMNIVERVNVTEGVLTVMLKNGGILRRSLLDIAEMKIGQ
jgi:hypothetical protein